MFPAWDVPNIEVVLSGGRYEGLGVGAEFEAVYGGPGGLEPRHLFHSELADRGYGLATELDDISTGRRHVHKSGETGEGLLTPTELMAGPQSFDLTEKGAVGLGLGRHVGCFSRVACQIGIHKCRMLAAGRVAFTLGKDCEAASRHERPDCDEDQHAHKNAAQRGDEGVAAGPSPVSFRRANLPGEDRFAIQVAPDV